MSSTHCVAVGWSGRHNGRKTLVEVFNGSHWHVVASPNAQGYAYSGLADVDCVSASRCVAVGNAFSITHTGARNRGIVAVFNGSKWHMMASPKVAGSALIAVWCTGTSSCVAVGGTATKTLIESYNGTRCGGTWHRTGLPALRKGQQYGLNGVSCVATKCVAVGYHRAGSGRDAALVEARARGGRWHVASAPAPRKGANSDLGGVDCVSVTHCVALGQTNAGRHAPVLAATFTGSRWSYAHPASPAGAPYVFLGAPSCTSSVSCVAVGNYYSTKGTAPLLAAVRTARGWKLRQLPNPPHAV
jgi:hypothetical protein